jgi:hypothetical protein
MVTTTKRSKFRLMKGRRVAYPDANGKGWRLRHLRRDGSTSESFSSTEPKCQVVASEIEADGIVKRWQNDFAKQKREFQKAAAEVAAIIDSASGPEGEEAEEPEPERIKRERGDNPGISSQKPVRITDRNFSIMPKFKPLAR